MTIPMNNGIKNFCAHCSANKVPRMATMVSERLEDSIGNDAPTSEESMEDAGSLRVAETLILSFFSTPAFMPRSLEHLSRTGRHVDPQISRCSWIPAGNFHGLDIVGHVQLGK